MSAPLDCDVAVIGAGFAGSLLALIARRLGLRVVLLERDRHPRFAIGESSTPLANLLLEELADRYELPELLPFVKWGAWQRDRPEISCGLKRGFSFFHHTEGQFWSPNAARSNELLVAASPHDAIADTHWYRADVDHAFAKLAMQRGAELFEQTALQSIEWAGSGAEISASVQGTPMKFRCRFVLDASGPRGFLSRRLSLREAQFPAMPPTQTLFSHFRDVTRWDQVHRPTETPPYPVDDAALHHVFDGGWIWVLRFNNGITSAGVAGTDALFHRLGLAEGASGWDRLLSRLPSVREQFRQARSCLPFRHWPRLTFRVARAANERWALAPGAAAFVDPLLSSGFPLTLLGIQRLAELLERDWRTERWRANLAAYEAATFQEVDWTADLVGALYQNMGRFETFSNLSLLYFAAAIFSESARRLDRKESAPGFLLCRHKAFSAAFRRCLEAARHESPAGEFSAGILKAIEDVNVAGLGDPSRRNWYPVRAEDLVSVAAKLA
ncbi:MAG TPA: FAD-dependent oxidoreductase [Pirellulaceae bacterium]|nr:FAD-dependent oxidoreductase [Pirellulaceae bacterium]